MNIHFCRIHLSFRSLFNLLGLLLLHRQRKVSVRPGAASALSPVKIAFLALGHRVAAAFFLEKVRLLASAPQDRNDRFSLVGQSAFHPRRDLVVLPAENKVVPDQLFQRGGKNRNPLISFRIPLYRSVPFSFGTQITRPVFPFPPKQLQPVSQRAPDVRFHEADQPLFPAACPGSGVSFLLPDSKPLPITSNRPLHRTVRLFKTIPHKPSVLALTGRLRQRHERCG